MNSVDEYARDAKLERRHVYVDTLSEWVMVVRSFMQIKIKPT